MLYLLKVYALVVIVVLAPILSLYLVVIVSMVVWLEVKRPFREIQLARPVVSAGAKTRDKSAMEMEATS